MRLPPFRPFSSSSPLTFDLAILGGGIVGAATARECLRRWPRLRCVILEKESRVAAHQSGSNSGVVHAGIYYQPGSLKAKLCVRGMRLMYKYCDSAGVPYRKIGKLIVATDSVQAARLTDLYNRGQQNQVEGLRLLPTNKEVREVEPNCAGLAALHSPNTGIVDFARVTEAMVDDFRQLGGDIACGFELKEVYDAGLDPDAPLTLVSSDGSRVKSRFLITCAGLHSDRVAALTQRRRSVSLPKIVPFRGDYLLLRSGRESLVQGNIYPVPDPRFPFLGVHFTPRMDGSVWLGPNAVLALKREGYRLTDFSAADCADALTYGGLWRLIIGNVMPGLREMYRVVNVRATVYELQKFIPDLSVDDVIRGPSGVRAQALDSSGRLVDDFVIDDSSDCGRVLHVCNAPSPAATSSLAIAEFVADKVEKTFGLSAD